MTSGLIFSNFGDEMTPPGFATLGTSAFVKSTAGVKVLRAQKNKETDEIPTDAALAEVDIKMQRIMPSERLSAEWENTRDDSTIWYTEITIVSIVKKKIQITLHVDKVLNLLTTDIGLNQIQTMYTNNGNDTQPWVKRSVEQQENVPLDFSNRGGKES